jgi:branched-chain amino acid transport system permease protein
MLALTIVLVALLAGLDVHLASAGDYDEAITRCQSLLPAFDDSPQNIRTAVQPGVGDELTGVRLDWDRRTPRAGSSAGWIVCWFVPREQTGGAWQINSVQSDEYGTLRRFDLQQLMALLHLKNYPPQQLGAPADTHVIWFLALLQHTINGLSLGCVYGLIAIGYALVYGITRIINFAFGEMCMMGAFIMVIGYAVVSWLGGPALPVALLTILLVSMAIVAAYGWTIDRLVFRPLRRAATTAPLIAALGLAISFKEYVRLLQGAKTRYLLVEDLTSWPIIKGAGFDVYLSKGHLLEGLATVAIGALLWWVTMRTSFGRNQRACAQDLHMAALLGVNVDRTIALTFVLGSAIAGAAGMFVAAQYGVVNFHMGTLMGFKALTAAMLGGIGSLPGAMAGGLIVGLTESYTAAAFGMEWKDVAVFIVLILVLLFRPSGLLGTVPLPTVGE